MCEETTPESVPVSEPESSLRLTPAEARVLGSLMEKEATTPEYYPLSLNALLNACNQRSSREPVMNLTEDELRHALDILEALHLAGRSRSAEGRVAKYEHWIGEAFNLTRAESALFCLLLLRGPQTPGELRGRSERIHRFDEISDVVAGLEKLMARSPALAAMLPRQPGTKEARYAHLLCGAVSQAQPVQSTPTAAASYVAPISADAAERIAALEAEVAALRGEFAELRRRFEELFA